MQYNLKDMITLAFYIQVIIMTQTPIGLEALVLKIYEAKRTEPPLKLDIPQA